MLLEEVKGFDDVWVRIGIIHKLNEILTTIPDKNTLHVLNLSLPAIKETCTKSCTGVYCKESVLKSYPKFRGEHLCWSLLSIV